MHILIASNSYPTQKNPTRQVFVKNIAEGLKSTEHDIEVLFNRYFQLFKSDPETGSIITKTLKVCFLLGSYLPHLLFKCRKYDILYSHAPFLPGLLMVFASKLHSIRHVTYAHGGVIANSKKKDWKFRLSKYALQNCDLILTNSYYMQNRLMQEYNVESIVITPGYSRNLFKNYNPKTRPIDILFAGRCIKKKGIYTLLQVLKSNSEFYRESNLSIHLHCSGVEKPNVIDYCCNNNLLDIITIGKNLTQENLWKKFNQSKIVIFPSLEESLGLVGIEAIACGAFLIASNTGGIPEYVRHGKNGLLFEPGNSADLHKAIKRAFEQKLWVQNQTPQKENEELLKEYSLERGVQQTLSHFKKLLSSGK